MEVLVITKEWILDDRLDEYEKFDIFTKIINRGFLKPKMKYNVIATPRVASPLTFLHDFGLSPEEPNACFFLFFLKQELYDEIYKKHNLYRDFEINDDEVKDPHSCDIPQEFAAYISDRIVNDVKIRILPPGEGLTQNHLQRVLGTTGFAFKKNEGSQLELYLSAVTSYMRGFGSFMLEYSEKIAFEKPIVSSVNINQNDFNKVVIHAEVIKEHDLLRFYLNRCGYEQSTDDTIEVKLLEDGTLENCPFSDHLVALSGFHIIPIYKYICIN